MAKRESLSLFDEQEETAIQQSPTPPRRATDAPVPGAAAIRRGRIYPPTEELVDAVRNILSTLPDGVTTDGVLDAMQFPDEARTNQHRSRVIQALVEPKSGWQFHRDEDGRVRYRRITQ